MEARVYGRFMRFRVKSWFLRFIYTPIDYCLVDNVEYVVTTQDQSTAYAIFMPARTQWSVEIPSRNFNTFREQALQIASSIYVH